MLNSPTRSRRIKAAIRSARIASAEISLDQRLADRRHGRAERTDHARRSAAGRVHKAYAQDALLNEMIRF